MKTACPSLVNKTGVLHARHLSHVWFKLRRVASAIPSCSAGAPRAKLPMHWQPSQPHIPKAAGVPTRITHSCFHFKEILPCSIRPGWPQRAVTPLRPAPPPRSTKWHCHPGAGSGAGFGAGPGAGSRRAARRGPRSRGAARPQPPGKEQSCSDWAPRGPSGPKGPKGPKEPPAARRSATAASRSQGPLRPSLVLMSAAQLGLLLWTQKISIKIDVLPSLEVEDTMFNPQQPKVIGVKFSLREIRRMFSIEIQKCKLLKMPKLIYFRFPEGWYFLNCDNTELKNPLNQFFLFPNGTAGR